MRTERQDAANSALNLWRFSLMSTAVTMTAAVAHLMELPAKMQYEPSLWVRLHRTMYPNFGRTAGPAEAAAVMSTSLLAWWTRRERPEAFRSTTVAAACLAAAHAIFWIVVQPVNAEVTRWPLDAIPPDWTKQRDRWEYGHAIRAGLVTAALGALVTSGPGEESAVTSIG
jgi:Domain of unknown function (DUF1772)